MVELVRRHVHGYVVQCRRIWDNAFSVMSYESSLFGGVSFIGGNAQTFWPPLFAHLVLSLTKGGIT